MTRKPITIPKTLRFLLELMDSGMSSADTTLIMAPAEKERRKGRISRIAMAATTPMTAAMGSTRPEAWP